MKTKLLLLAVLALTSVSSFGQTTLFFDNFNPATYPIPDATANVNFSGVPSNISTANYTYTGMTSATAGWFTTSSNGASGRNCIWSSSTNSYSTNLSIQGTTASSNTYRGVATIATPLSGFTSGFNTKLKLNTGTLTWSFAMRLNRSSALHPLAFNALTPSGAETGQTGNLSAGLILATNANANDLISAPGSTATGYAVMLTGSDVYSAMVGTVQTSTANLLTLGRFHSGITSDGTPSTAATNTSYEPFLSFDNLTSGSSSAVSVIVTYTGSTGKWTLTVRDDATNSLQDPLATTAKVYPTAKEAVNDEYTSDVSKNMMAYYNVGGTTGFYLDNLKVTTSANLGVSQNEVSGLNVYPNPVSNGVVYINSNSSDAKKVSVFDVLGKQLLQKEVSNGALNVSSLNKGVYLMKVSEGAASSTRKLIIN